MSPVAAVTASRYSVSMQFYRTCGNTTDNNQQLRSGVSCISRVVVWVDGSTRRGARVFLNVVRA
eukprot:COSAG02_NODE_65943_length_256_cov_1.955414_1_plen_63_part_10